VRQQGRKRCSLTQNKGDVGLMFARFTLKRVSNQRKTLYHLALFRLKVLLFSVVSSLPPSASKFVPRVVIPRANCLEGRHLVSSLKRS